MAPPSARRPLVAGPIVRRPVARGSRHRAAAESPAHAAAAAPTLPPLELDQLRDAWQRDVVDAVRSRSIPISTLVAEARPVEIRGDTVTIEFAPAAGFHRAQIEDPKNLAMLREALYEVTGRRLDGRDRRRRLAGADRARGSARALRGGRDLTAQGHIRRRGSGGALMAKFDMNAMLKQAQQMQAQMMEAQEQAKLEVVEASAGGGMVTVKANGGGEIVEIRIDPKAIDPDDPEMLADIVMAAANEALRSRQRARRVEDQEPDARPRSARPAGQARLGGEPLEPAHPRAAAAPAQRAGCRTRLGAAASADAAAASSRSRPRRARLPPAASASDAA